MKQLSEYEITWKIEITASSPREAAIIAQEIQRDPNSTANVFRVGQQINGELVKYTTIDLDE